MELEVRDIQGCPNGDIAEARLKEALAGAGLAHLPVRRRRVADAEEARRLDFRGSPEIRIDGVDPFAGDGHVGFACRVYRSDGGTLDGAPSVAQLGEALTDRRR